MSKRQREDWSIKTFSTKAVAVSGSAPRGQLTCSHTHLNRWSRFLDINPTDEIDWIHGLRHRRRLDQGATTAFWPWLVWDPRIGIGHLNHSGLDCRPLARKLGGNLSSNKSTNAWVEVVARSLPVRMTCSNGEAGGRGT